MRVLSEVLILALIKGLLCKYLFGSDPQGGLWGGEIRYDGLSIRDESKGFPQRGYIYGTISYDPVSGHVLLEVVEDTGEFHGLVKGSLCESDKGKTLEVILERVQLVDDSNPHLVGCGPDCGWSGFTLYDSQIYFLFVGQYGLFAQDLVTRVELRVLEGCEDLLPIRGDDPVLSFARKTDFPVLKCSRKIATIVEKATTENNGLKAGKHTAIRDSGWGLEFAFLLSHSTYDAGVYHVTTNVYHVLETGQVNLVNHTTDQVNFDLWKIRGQGGISFGTTYMCWSSFKRVYCIRHYDYQDIMEMEIAAEASAVCKGDDYTISSLVLAADGDADWRLYFGCSGPGRPRGGAGVVLYRHSNWYLSIIRQGRRKLKATSLLVVDALPASCQMV